MEVELASNLHTYKNLFYHQRVGVKRTGTLSDCEVTILANQKDSRNNTIKRNILFYHESIISNLHR